MLAVFSDPRATSARSSGTQPGDSRGKSRRTRKMQRGIAGMAKLNRRAAVALVALLMAAPVLTIGVVVTAIAAPATPLPNEGMSQGVTKYSFIAYGDTRGRRDGVAIQYEHSL